MLSGLEVTPPVDEPLPVPNDVESLILDRVSMLPRRTYDLLVAAACTSSARPELLRDVVGDFGAADLDPARKAGIARFERGVVTFAHPLYASAVYASASATERRSLHRRFAEAVQEPVERARHLALAAEGRDETVAAVVHEAAVDTARRGSPAAAAELTQLALDLGDPDAVTELGRIVDLATYLRRAGDNERARKLLEDVDSWAGSTYLHADALELLIEIEFWVNGPSAEFERIAAPLLDDAAPVDVRARLHASLARYSNHDIARSATHAETALALLDELGDDAPAETRATALADLVRCKLLLGDGLDRAAVDRVLELEAAMGAAPSWRRPPSESFGFCLRYADDIEGSRALLTQRAREDLETGYESGALNALQHLAVTECLAGDFALALDYARRACDLHDRQEQSILGYAPAILALVQAHRGEIDEVREVAERYDAFDQSHNTYLRAALGLLELSLARSEEAFEHCLHVIALAETFGAHEPGVYRVHANAAEAAVAVGDLSRADALVAELERHARRTNHRWSRSAGLRAHALVLAARGDLDAAVETSSAALAAHETLAMPFERARTMVVRGQVLRRRGERSAARDALQEASREFERLGARLWVERAREELGRIPIRRSSGDQLTPAERRVAELVAQGKSNDEVAQALFVSKKTVEANLTRIYRKLGVRSRFALAARLGLDTGGDAAEV
jgi:DNA-binding CsgD family transcriptional regulator